MFRFQRLGLLAATLLLALAQAPALAGPRAERWVSAWTSAQLLPNPDSLVPDADLEDVTIRQFIRPSLAGEAVRLRLSNLHGTKPLTIEAVTLARQASPATSRIVPESLREVRFNGAAKVTIPAGAEVWSDTIRLEIQQDKHLAVSFYLPVRPDRQHGHAGSRTTSFFLHGRHSDKTELAGARTAPRWLFLSGLEVQSHKGAAVVAFGDSITDGYGVQPDTEQRWTDHLAARVRGKSGGRGLAVLNAGIGGNRLLLDGTGPNALARLERDVFSQPGVTHLIVLEGVNDLGVLTRDGPVTPEAHAALVEQMITAYRQIVIRAHSRGIKVIGGTILPYGGSKYYHPDAANEADRQAVNAWIRTPGNFDGVIDFDAALRDPAKPTHLRPELDSGDGLHPSIAGYKAMAAAVPLGLMGLR